MAGLPEAYQLDRVREGLMMPDFAAFDAALPPTQPTDRELEIVPLRELGDRIFAYSEALPKIGKQGTFGYIYGTLTHALADRLDGRLSARYLPAFENPDDLVVQANYFAQDWFDPCDQYRKPLAADNGDNMHYSYVGGGMSRPWMYSLEEPLVQFGEPSVQFVAGGMGTHILADLGGCLVRSGVSAAYMRRGGDYDKVNTYIRHVTMQKAPELIQGNRPLVWLAVQPVPMAIAGMRRVARANYNELMRADGDPELTRVIQAGAEADALRANKMMVKYGSTALKLFALAAGAGQLVERTAAKQS